MLRTYGAPDTFAIFLPTFCPYGALQYKYLKDYLSTTMFNLFKKKDSSSIKVKDKVWMSEAAKLNAIYEAWKKNPETVFIFWFDASLDKANALFQNESNIASVFLTAREASTAHLSGKTIVFAEHYPLLEKETALFEKLHLTDVSIWSGLDEPLFKRFGADKIISTMKALGMKEQESIEHNMITKSIHNAQEKIAAKVTIDHTARSQEEWMQKTLG
jgi:hypothetical protein